MVRVGAVENKGERPSHERRSRAALLHLQHLLDQMSRPLVTLLSSQLHGARSCVASTARSALPSSSTPTLSRAQPGFQSVRGVATESLQDRVNALQERQRKMAEKAGRMKQMPGVVSS